MVCLGSVPRGHTSDVRFIFELFLNVISQKKGKLLVTILDLSRTFEYFQTSMSSDNPFIEGNALQVVEDES